MSPGNFAGSPVTLRSGSYTLLSGAVYSPLVSFANVTSDRIAVTGTVSIGGFFASLLNPVAVGTGTIPTGTVLTIIDNDGADPVVGTFGGLPEGATLTINGQTFVISYVGGDGNDVTLSLLSGLTVNPPTLPNGTVNNFYSRTLTSSGGTGPYTFAVTAGVLPDGLTLNATTGVIDGIAEIDGSFPFTVRATDSVGATGDRSYTLDINPAIVLIPSTLPNGAVGTPYNQDLAAFGGNNGPYTLSIVTGSLPSGLMLNQMTGAITGTPTTQGSSEFLVRATDSSGATGDQSYTLAIGPGGPVTLSPATLPNGTRFQPYSQFVVASGGSGDFDYFVSSGFLPGGISLNSSTGQISGNPFSEGTFNFTIRAEDNLGNFANQAYTIVIAPAMPLVVNPPTLPNGTVGTPYNQTVTATNGFGPYSFSVTAGALPTGLILNSGGRIRGTPTTAGTFTFTIRAQDDFTGGGAPPGTRDYTVTISPFQGVVLSPPTLPDGIVGAPYNQAVVASGGTGPYTYDIFEGNLPDGLTLNETTGVISGTPTAAGPALVQIIGTDSTGASGTRVYEFTINPAGTITLSPPTLPNGTVGTRYAQTVLASGGTPPYSFSVSGNLPPGLTLNPLGGSLTGVPTTAGSFTFTVIVNDTLNQTGFRTYTINIAPAFVLTLSPPTLPNGTVGSPYRQQITVTGGAGPFTFSLFDSLPAGLTLSSSGLISGTPTTAGTSNFAVIVNDPLGGFGSRDYSITVVAVPVPPVPPPPVPPPPVPPPPVPPPPVPPPPVPPPVPPVVPVRLFAVGTGAGAEPTPGRPQVRVFEANGSGFFDLNPFAEPGYTGGARVAVGDINGDGVDDIVVGAGRTGAPRVVVIDGATRQQILSFFAYPDVENGNSNRLGIFVAVGDVTGDGVPDIVTGIGSGGGARVRVFDPTSATPGVPVRDFFAYATDFLGGVRVAVGDVTGDGVADIVTSPGPSGGPEVRIFDARTLPPPFPVVVATPSASFVGMNPDYRGGTFVAVAAPKVLGVNEAVGGSLIVLSPDSFPDFEQTPLQTDFSDLPNADGRPSVGSASNTVLSAAPVAELYALTYSGATTPAVAVVRAAAFFPVLTPAATTGVRVAFGTRGDELGLFVGSGPLAGGQFQFYQATIDGRIADRPTLDVDVFGPDLQASIYVAGSIPAEVPPPLPPTDRTFPPGFTLILPLPQVRTVF